jgi:hypothetical protein
MAGVSGRDFTELGFKLEGEHYVRGSVVVWICEDEDMSDQYFYGDEKIRTREQLNAIINQK